jgi:hypothetical protein
MSTKINVQDVLRQIADATLSPSGHAFITSEAVKTILAAAPGTIEVDLNVRDKQGNVAARASQTGLDQVYGRGEPIVSAEVPHENMAPGFTIENNVPIPEVKRGILGEPRYPFAMLEVGQSFFVPKSKQKPNPAKTLASTVSSANKRFEKHNKRFVIRPVEGGARIWRTE